MVPTAGYSSEATLEGVIYNVHHWYRVFLWCGQTVSCIC